MATELQTLLFYLKIVKIFAHNRTGQMSQPVFTSSFKFLQTTKRTANESQMHTVCQTKKEKFNTCTHLKVDS